MIDVKKRFLSFIIFIKNRTGTEFQHLFGQ